MTTSARIPILLTVACCALGAPAGFAGPGGGNPILDELFGEAAQARPAPPEPTWRPAHDTVVWIDETSIGELRLVEFQPASGKVTVLLDSPSLHRLASARGLDGLVLDDLVWRPDGGAVLLTSGDRPVLYDFSAAAIRTLKTGDGDEMHAPLTRRQHEFGHCGLPIWGTGEWSSRRARSRVA